MEGPGESTLRAKYLDWCSARLAERFLDLSPEEIYELARPASARADASPESGSPSSPEPASSPELPSDTPSSPSLPRPTEEGYRALVQRVTEALLRRTSLPTFEQWAEAYEEAPERFEAELLGFWEDVVGEDSEADAGDGDADER